MAVGELPSKRHGERHDIALLSMLNAMDATWLKSTRLIARVQQRQEKLDRKCKRKAKAKQSTEKAVSFFANGQEQDKRGKRRQVLAMGTMKRNDQQNKKDESFAPQERTALLLLTGCASWERRWAQSGLLQSPPSCTAG